ncbi:hypothetical protein AB0J38_25950 [Streptomyces sp. NPDC050095]|uniref:hypothetical protein n=1 Tax=unclassified Streptomyces TaxID=2593676 RepID=UPI00342FE933
MIILNLGVGMGVRGTSISAFGFGVNWEFTKSDRLIAQQVMDFLADRRVLTIGFGRPGGDAEPCLASAAECRQRLSEYLDQIQKPKSDLRVWLRAIRQAFTEFIEAGGPEARGFRGGDNPDHAFNDALSVLRAQVRQTTDVVAGRYKLHGLGLPPGDQRSARAE